MNLDFLNPHMINEWTVDCVEKYVEIEWKECSKKERLLRQSAEEMKQRRKAIKQLKDKLEKANELDAFGDSVASVIMELAEVSCDGQMALKTKNGASIETECLSTQYGMLAQVFIASTDRLISYSSGGLFVRFAHEAMRTYQSKAISIGTVHTQVKRYASFLVWDENALDGEGGAYQVDYEKYKRLGLDYIETYCTPCNITAPTVNVAPPRLTLKDDSDRTSLGLALTASPLDQPLDGAFLEEIGYELIQQIAPSSETTKESMQGVISWLKKDP